MRATDGMKQALDQLYTYGNKLLLLAGGKELKRKIWGMDIFN